MRKMKKPLALLLTLVMVLSLIPMTAAFAEGEGDAIGTGELQTDFGSDLSFTLVNDAAYPVIYRITVEGKESLVRFEAGESLTLSFADGINYAVELENVASPYYKVLSSSKTVTVDGVEQDFEDPWEHMVGETVKSNIVTYWLDETHETSVDANDVITFDKNGSRDPVEWTYGQKSSKLTWTPEFKNSDKMIRLTGKNGQTNYDSATERSAYTKESKAKAALDEAAGKAMAAYPGWIPANTLGVSITWIVKYFRSLSGELSLYRPVYAEQIMVNCADAGNITLSYQVEITERLGDVSFNAIDNHVLEYGNNLVKDLTKLAAFDTMPDCTVVLDEIDQGDGCFEGRHYELALTGTDKVLASTAVYAQIYRAEGVRCGKYLLTVCAPGEGFIAIDPVSYEITVSEGITTAAGTQLSSYLVAAPLAGKLKGVRFNLTENSVSFTNVNVGTRGIPGATFVLINRDQLLENANIMLSLGKDVLDSIVGGISFEKLAELRDQILSGSETVSADSGTALDLLTSFAKLFANGKLQGVQAPAILEAKANANGIVTFTPDSNVTVTMLANLLPDMIDGLYRLDLLGLIPKQLQINTDMLRNLGSLGGDLVYSTLKTLGLVGNKFPTGSYVMYQKLAPEGTYFRNIALYTVNNYWNGASYETYAQLGVIGPLFQSQFRAFLEQLTKDERFDAKAPSGLEQYARWRVEAREAFTAKLIEQNASFNVWIRSFAENDKLRAALLAYAGQFVYTNAPDQYESVEQAIDAIKERLTPDFSYDELINDVSDMLSHLSNPFGGYVDTNWYFYNISKNIFTNSFGAFDYALRVLLPDEDVDKLEKPFEEGAGKLIEDTDKLITDTEDMIDRISTEIEEKNEELRDKIGEAIRDQIGDLIEDMTKRDEQTPEEAPPAQEPVEKVVEVIEVVE